MSGAGLRISSLVLVITFGCVCGMPIWMGGANLALPSAFRNNAFLASGSLRRHAVTLLRAGKKGGDSAKGSNGGWGPGNLLEMVDFGGRKTLVHVFDTVLVLVFISCLATDKHVLRFVLGESSFKQCVTGMYTDLWGGYKQKGRDIQMWMEQRTERARERAEEERKQREQSMSAAERAAAQGDSKYPPGSLGNPIRESKYPEEVSETPPMHKPP
eukprot:CAMPEP_0181297304 /NCGR_PEP_ID=MMETSP1101-20121128/5167_1 /TAXON_ID=46948 /ORGANISM="Rhodomonas abbreviata, Strain Caron Lab Isolate" /LENGTH=213 /DNA_ID=CAMNT_0023402229 /DNA_START=86 /DNA_END=724 /DNA_ORIENTATION=+